MSDDSRLPIHAVLPQLKAALRDGRLTEALAEIEALPEPVREPEPIRGDYGTAVSRRTVKKCQVEDYDVAYIHVSKNTKVREAIDKAIAAQVRSGVEEIPGVRIWDDVAVSNR